MESDSYLESIPLSQSDQLLRSWGFDLTKEYFQIVTERSSRTPSVIELATGTGRMCAVLSGIFEVVVTGDITLHDHPRAQGRILPEFAHRVQFTVLDMEQLPFKDNSVPFLMCVNTLHEVDLPVQCLHEMIRVVGKGSELIVGDFNDLGFETMQRIHEIVYHNNHSTGTISLSTVEEMLSSSFTDVRTMETSLNTTFIASGKRPSPFY